MIRRLPAGRPALTLTIAALAAALAGGGCREATTGPEIQPLTLVSQDEFDGPAGQPPDTAKWVHDVGGWGWGNNQLEYDTDRPENSSLDGEGHLAIVARREDYEGRAYTSARINTRGRYETALGRFEARIKLPKGQGLWPAFWMLGSDFGTAGWPTCGEIDIMEYRGQQPSIVHGSLHGPGYSGGEALTSPFQLRTTTFDRDFHTFAVEWELDRIVWYVDDIPYQTATPSDLPSNTRWVFDHPFFVILNLAVGGNYVGPPDETTVFPQTMLVDWVRVYQAKS
jgi:beta-glucanase (GH16 family)